VLGRTEISEPAALAARGGARLRAGGLELHLASRTTSVPPAKRIPVSLVSDLGGVVESLRQADQDRTGDGDVPGFRRA
jgi:hypothetical protein